MAQKARAGNGILRGLSLLWLAKKNAQPSYRPGVLGDFLWKHVENVFRSQLRIIKRNLRGRGGGAVLRHGIADEQAEGQ